MRRLSTRMPKFYLSRRIDFPGPTCPDLNRESTIGFSRGLNELGLRVAFTLLVRDKLRTDVNLLTGLQVFLNLPNRFEAACTQERLHGFRLCSLLRPVVYHSDML